MIEAFTARAFVRVSLEPSPLEPERLPKHVRYRCVQAEQTEAALRFAACMRDQGLDWPDPAADGSKFAGSDVKVDKKSPEFQAAFEVCGDDLAVEDASGAGQ